MPDRPDIGWYDSFDTEKIGGSIPYYKCVECGRSVPEINYSLSGHYSYCKYRIRKELERKRNGYK